MATENSKGTQAATLDTEHNVANITTAGTYSGYVDCSNVTGSDRVVLRVYIEVDDGGTDILVIEDVILGVDIDSGVVTPLWVHPPFLSVYQYTLSIEQTDGTGRNYDWQVVTP